MNRLTDNALQVLADHAESEGSCAMDGVTLGLIVSELRSTRLTDDERAALGWASKIIDALSLHTLAAVTLVDSAADMRTRALAVLTRLTTTGRG